MIDQNNILTRDQHRLELAMLMAEYEKKEGPVQTLPILFGDKRDPAWRIHCPDKPKAGNNPKPAAAKNGDNQTAPSFKAGETKVIQAGPNKGKTAVYDGTGWALK